MLELEPEAIALGRPCGGKGLNSIPAAAPGVAVAGFRGGALVSFVKLLVPPVPSRAAAISSRRGFVAFNFSRVEYVLYSNSVQSGSQEGHHLRPVVSCWSIGRLPSASIGRPMSAALPTGGPKSARARKASPSELNHRHQPPARLETSGREEVQE